MRLKVSSSNTGSEDNASSAAERNSGVVGLVALIFGGCDFAGSSRRLAVATAAGGRGGAACGDIRVG